MRSLADPSPLPPAMTSLARPSAADLPAASEERWTGDQEASPRRRTCRWVLGCTLLLGVVSILGKGSGNAGETKGQTPTTVTELSLAQAKDRAKIMQQIYLSTLLVMHDRYFHSNRAVLPARAMEDIFVDVAEDTGAEARWIAVNAKAMSVDHQPQTEFEKSAAEKLAAGQTEYEELAESVYRYAVAVPLGAGCVGCHTGFSASASLTPKVAGLVFSIPVKEQ